MIAPKLEKQTKADERVARALVTLRDEGMCVRCRRVGAVTNFDHRKNRSQGGRWSAANGQTLCGTGTTGCHGFVTSHPALAYVEGWGVPGWADPTSYPAARYLPTKHGTVRAAFVLYDDDGGWVEITEQEARERMEGTAA